MRGSRQQRGFTLIEMITTVVIIGIIAAVITPVINIAMRSYADTEARHDLTARGRIAIERIARELRHAVPNSISIINDGTGQEGIEFLSARTGGRYVAAIDNFGSAFSVVGRRFEKGVSRTALYLIVPGLSFQSGDHLVIGNGSPTALSTGATVVPISTISDTLLATDGTADGKVVTFGAHTFPNNSPGKHAQIADYTHEVGIAGDGLHWHRNSGISHFDLAQDWSAADPLLVHGVTGVNFTYIPGTPQSTGTLRIELALANDKESIELYHEIQIRNTP
ncbi:MAG: prepilin-type N-terminal cleavage/methylation domain-containing protein [Chromatiales bacterium]|nr:prepilin-type N-terminal cleavage/methylation domain-containing protein [Chromatiales bacterium]